MKPRFSPSCDRFCVKMADRTASRRYSLKKQTRWSSDKTIIQRWCVFFQLSRRELKVFCIIGQQLPTMLGVVASVARRLKFSLFQTLGSNSQQHATTCSRECKRTQHITSNNVGGCWPTMLRLFARGFRCLHRVTSHSSADFVSCWESPSFHVNNRREAKLMTLAWVVVWKYSF